MIAGWRKSELGSGGEQSSSSADQPCGPAKTGPQREIGEIEMWLERCAATRVIECRSALELLEMK
jgi:hypothetical protein